MAAVVKEASDVKSAAVTMPSVPKMVREPPEVNYQNKTLATYIDLMMQLDHDANEQVDEYCEFEESAEDRSERSIAVEALI